MDEQYELKNDILLVAYFMNENGWNAISKTNFQRVLYFSATLSPVFMNEYEWSYNFANTLFGPINRDLTAELEELYAKRLLCLAERKIALNRVEEKYFISEQGIDTVTNIIMKIIAEESKILWLKLIVKVLSIYEESFLSKLIKEDPNVSNMNNNSQKAIIPIGNNDDNLSKELLLYLQSAGKEKLKLENDTDEEYLMLFFDLLYRKYKEGR